MRNLGNFALGVGVDILRGAVGSRDGQTVLASVREARRTVEAGQKIGANKQVLDAPGEAPALDEEAALLARLEEIRRARGG